MKWDMKAEGIFYLKKKKKKKRGSRGRRNFHMNKEREED